MIPNPEGKMTYPDDVKIHLFQQAYDAFKPWHEKVFFYLCMEERKLWESTFGYAYQDNQEFENCLIDNAWKKLTC